MWSEHGQTQRFLAVLRHLQLREGDSLLDFGSGTGRLCEFLPSGIDYFAYDWAPGMIERVREHARAQVVEELAVYDHVVALGTFNLADSWSIKETFGELSLLYLDHAEKTLAVSLYRGEDPACLAYGLEEIAAFVRTVGCRRYFVDASYLDNDFLAVLYR